VEATISPAEREDAEDAGGAETHAPRMVWDHWLLYNLPPQAAGLPAGVAASDLPPGTLEALLKDKAKLTAVLTYHVVAGKVMASDVVKLSEAKTVQGQNVKIGTIGGVMVNDAHVVKTDIMASNGVIHVIDKVILPN
jgi:hypothetical protein